MEKYKEEFANFLIKTNALFFKQGLTLKDGRPTPYFVNIGMFNDGETTYELGKFYAETIVSNGLHKNLDIIFGPSYKGSAIAQATAIALFKEHKLKVGFNYDRKEAKTHGEASKSSEWFVGAKFFNKCNVLMVDDVITSAATKFEAIEKIQSFAKENNLEINLTALIVAVDREQKTLEGENALKFFTKKTGVPVYSILKITEAINFLVGKKFNEKIFVSEENKKELNKYLKKYGVN